MSTVRFQSSDSEVFAPAPGWSDLDPGAHVVHFYSEESHLLDGLSQFIGTALEAQDSAVVVATPVHREQLLRRLKARGIDVGSALHCDRLISLDAAETLCEFMSEGTPDSGRFAEIVGAIITRATKAAQSNPPRVAVFGEMVAELWADGNGQGAIQLEQLWNDLARSHAFSLRCAYPMKSFDRGEHCQSFTEICTQHSHVVPAKGPLASANDEFRASAIAQLQQKAQALDTEMAHHREIQASLRRKESDLAEILENAVEGVQQLGAGQEILWANRALLEMLGYSREEYVQRPLADFCEDAATFHQYWERLMRREDISDYPLQLKCRDGSLRDVLVHSSGHWENDAFLYTRCFLRDVTQQKQMEQALRVAERHAGMGRLAGAIAHEINGPLETVMNVFYLLRMHPSLDERARELARCAEQEISRIAHIAKQALSFYRESNKPVSVSLSRVAEEVLEFYARQIQLGKITIERRLEKKGVILGFPGEIRQVFINLIGNALQAIPPGGTLRVTVRKAGKSAVRQGRSGILVNVTDTGRGVPEQYRDKLFQPFVTTRAEKGTGMGLWISRGIIEKVEGTIRFRSGSVRGKTITSFAVFIPIEEAALLVLPEEPKPRPLGITGASPFPPGESV